MNPADRNALEFALQIKEAAGRSGGAAEKGKVTVVMLAPPESEGVLKEALALDADQAVILSDPAFQGGDETATAIVLARAASRLQADLILCGEGQVGHRVAEALRMPSVSSVTGIAFDQDHLKVTVKNHDLREMVVTSGKRLEVDTESGGGNGNHPGQPSEQVSENCPIPLLASVIAGSNTPRIANALKIMKAAKKEINQSTPVDLDLSTQETGLAAAGMKRLRSFLPEEN